MKQLFTNKYHSIAQNNNFKYLILVLSFISLSITTSWGQALPSITPTLYPTPASSAEYLDNVSTKYISNYSCETTTWSGTYGLGVDVIGWSFDAGIGGGKIAVGTHPLTVTTSFTGLARTSSLDLPNAVDIRVGYMEPYIVAAYYDMVSNQYKFSYFNWAAPFGTSISLAGTFILPTSGTPTTYERISMDINHDHDKVAIIYSQGGDVFAVGLLLSASVFTPLPTTYYSILTMTGVPVGANTNPDIAFNRDPITGRDWNFYTFYNSSYGQEFVFSTEFNTIFTAGSSPSSYYGAEALPIGVNSVNFDCPDHYSFGHWAYTYSDGNKIYLRADTSISPSPLPYTTIINDGSLSGLTTDISMYTNIAPVLTYKTVGYRDEIFVAWASGAAGFLSPSTLSTPYSESYLGITVGVNKVAWGPKCSSGPNYAFIDNDPASHYMTTRPLIALDRNTLKSQRFVSYATDNMTSGYELKHKNVDFFNNLYRTTNPLDNDMTKAATAKLYPNPFVDAITLQIPNPKAVWDIILSDLLGRQIAKYHGLDAPSFVQQTSRRLPSGQYILKLQSENCDPQTVNIVKQ